jgi:hypothetical protein
MVALSRRIALASAAVVVGGTSLFVAPPVAVHADTVTVFDGMPSQEFADLPSTDPRNSSNQGGWGDMAGGVASRPYITSLAVINNGITTPIINAGTTTPPAASAGRVTAVVSPVNLCRTGQPAQPGMCYATPNRVALTVGYSDGDSVGYNFSQPRVPVTPTVNASTVIDMTVALNTLGQSLRWSWLNGDLLYWQTTHLGRPDATVRVKFKPASAPYLAHWPANTGCTATPIFNCNIPRADGEVLTASMLFSLDNTLDPVLAGAVFATQNAIAGYLQPGGTPTAPTLDIQAGSTHARSDGTPQLGTVKAFLPAAALLNMYGVLPSDAATAFTTTRTGDPGTNAPPTYTPWTAEANGADGLLVAVTGVTFSVPRYQVKGILLRTPSQATVKGADTTVTASVAACSAKAPCTATVYDLGRQAAARFVVTRTAILSNKRVVTKALSLTAPSTRLKKGNRYLLVVRSAKTGKAIVSTLGTVK